MPDIERVQSFATGLLGHAQVDCVVDRATGPACVSTLGHDAAILRSRKRHDVGKRQYLFAQSSAAPRPETIGGNKGVRARSA